MLYRLNLEGDSPEHYLLSERLSPSRLDIRSLSCFSSSVMVSSWRITSLRDGATASVGRLGLGAFGSRKTPHVRARCLQGLLPVGIGPRGSPSCAKRRT